MPGRGGRLRDEGQTWAGVGSETGWWLRAKNGGRATRHPGTPRRQPERTSQPGPPVAAASKVPSLPAPGHATGTERAGLWPLGSPGARAWTAPGSASAAMALSRRRRASPRARAIAPAPGGLRSAGGQAGMHAGPPAVALQENPRLRRPGAGRAGTGWHLPPSSQLSASQPWPVRSRSVSDLRRPPTPRDRRSLSPTASFDSAPAHPVLLAENIRLGSHPLAGSLLRP